MSFADSAAFSVEVEAAGTPTGVPQWLAQQGNPHMTWVQVPFTTMSDMDLAPLDPIIAGDRTGIATARYGHPIQSSGIMSQSGGTVRINGSELLLFGGGGAGSWAGNDIRGLRLEDDSPRWTVRRPPSADYWPRSGQPGFDGVSHPYMQDGVTPNSRHSYWVPQFCDGTDEFFTFGCWQVWETDSHPVPGVDQVDSLDWSTKLWLPPNTNPVLPATTNNDWDGNWTCKHQTTELFYKAVKDWLHVYNPVTRTWAGWQYRLDASTFSRATACVDPDLNIILVIGTYGAQDNCVYALSLGGTITKTNALFTGPYGNNTHAYVAGKIWNGYQYGNGMVYDRILRCFLWYQDDGFIYTITKGATLAEWFVDRLPLQAGTSDHPPALSTNTSGGFTSGASIFGKFQYLPNLKGFAMQLSCEQNCYFVRTGT